MSEKLNSSKSETKRRYLKFEWDSNRGYAYCFEFDMENTNIANTLIKYMC